MRRIAYGSEDQSITDLLLQPLIEPVPHGLVPQLRILRLQHPVPFVREVEHLRRDVAALQRREKLEALVDRHAEIELAMRDERRRLEVLREVVRRPTLVQLRVVPRVAFELP